MKRALALAIALAGIVSCSTLLIPSRQPHVTVARRIEDPRLISPALFLRQFVQTDDLIMTRSAYAMAVAAYQIGWAERRETALCVTAWDTVSGWVIVYKFDPPAFVALSDSLHVTFGCQHSDDSFLHIHLVDNGWRYTPSPPDSEVTRKFVRAFHLLMSDPTTFTIYGRNP